jgi:predicted unusual protein kinase regulating ubiquinone biosynthesis (AarF/ABC1/UbiB family)
MRADLPTGKVERVLSGGRMAAKVGGSVLTYYAKRPFLSRDGRRRALDNAARQGAQAMFRGLSLLRGTALKMAQQLSLEIDLLPESACRELAKSYHQVPPINRALVRKVVREALGNPPEALFSRFDLDAFAAASLGQVHYAADAENTALAVKVQYPGIAGTIHSDVGLLRQLLRPLVESEQLVPTLNEVADRLREEVDYLQEAEHQRYFAGHLNVDGVRIPHVLSELTAPTVLTTTLMPGKPLDVWLGGNPSQEARDHVAQKLSDVFLKGLYELNVIHADPNPGNFIIADDLTIGLVDFGCVKRLEPDFVEHYRRLTEAVAHQRNEDHFGQMIALGLVPPDLADADLRAIKTLSDAAADWFSRLFSEEYFDFGVRKTFMAEGKAVMRCSRDLRRHFNVNPDVIFPDRTRYGLLRIFEMMGARLKFRNSYEW